VVVLVVELVVDVDVLVEVEVDEGVVVGATVVDVVVDVDVVVLGAVKVPTITWTVEPLAAWPPAAGFWDWTNPSWDGSVTGVVVNCGESPTPDSAAWACAWLLPTTAGTVTCGTPVETYTVTVEPTATGLPAGGDVRVT
jgi:hypothetical protein